MEKFERKHNEKLNRAYSFAGELLVGVLISMKLNLKDNIVLLIELIISVVLIHMMGKKVELGEKVISWLNFFKWAFAIAVANSFLGIIFRYVEETGAY